MSKQLPKSKPNYSLRRRFFDQIGRPMEWKDYGKGYFTDLQTVQNQIKALASVNRRVEIEFIHEGKLCGFDGKETGKTIVYETR